VKNRPNGTNEANSRFLRLKFDAVGNVCNLVKLNHFSKIDGHYLFTSSTLTIFFPKAIQRNK
jgi:hypothetical protein